MSPIKTVIRNLTDQPYNIYWAGKREVYLPAKGERIIEADIWSEGNAQQRDAVIAAADTGNFELALLIMSKDGVFVQVPYCPQFAAVKYIQPVSAEVPAEKKQDADKLVREEPKVEDAEKGADKEDKFNVSATSAESRETLAKLGAKPAEDIEREPVPALEFEKAEEVVEEEKPIEEAKSSKKARSKK